MGARMLSEKRAEQLADLFKALADPGRLRLMSAVLERERCVHELSELVGMEQSAVSHQLRRLRDGDLVHARREGRHMYYSLADEHVRDILDVGAEHVAHGQRSKK